MDRGKPAESPAPLRPDVFSRYPQIVAGFSTRLGGVSTGPYASLNLGSATEDAPEHILQNRRRLFEPLGLSPDSLVVAGQVHGSDVLYVDKAGVYPGFDGLVTDVPGLVLTISAADCAAVLLADPDSGVIGACHAGWRGAAANIVVATITLMAQRGASARRTSAFVSPCISEQNFEVGPEVAVRFPPEFVSQSSEDGRPHVDLKGTLRSQLIEAGLRENNIEVSPACTFADTNTYFSHRAEHGRTGRMSGFIALRD